MRVRAGMGEHATRTRIAHWLHAPRVRFHPHLRLRLLFRLLLCLTHMRLRLGLSLEDACRDYSLEIASSWLKFVTVRTGINLEIKKPKSETAVDPNSTASGSIDPNSTTSGSATGGVYVCLGFVRLYDMYTCLGIGVLYANVYAAL